MKSKAMLDKISKTSPFCKTKTGFDIAKASKNAQTSKNTLRIFVVKRPVFTLNFSKACFEKYSSKFDLLVIIKNAKIKSGKKTK